MRRLSAVLLGASAALMATPLSGQLDVATLGPQVGDRVPLVRLIDQRGRTQTLETLAGPKGTLLLFFRSADW
jgi:hypothetical protein